MDESLEFDQKPLEIIKDFASTLVENVFAAEEITIEEVKIEMVSD